MTDITTEQFLSLSLLVKNEPAAHGEEPAEPVVKNALGRVEKGGEQ